MSNYDIRNSPKCPYGELPWRKYYWRFDQKALDYDGEYWGCTVDPDGYHRDMLSDAEKEKQVAELQYVIEKIHSREPGKIIDVGCGPGFLLSAIGPEWEKHGVDLSQQALEHAKQYAQIQKGEFVDLDYPSNYFDAVIFHHVIEHLSDPVSYIVEAGRVLKPNGLAVISTPDFDSGCARRFKQNYRMLHDKGHISLFTHFSIVQMLEDLNFRVLEVEYPFFESQWFTKENLLRMMDTSKVSPPFYGSHMTVFAEKK